MVKLLLLASNAVLPCKLPQIFQVLLIDLDSRVSYFLVDPFPQIMASNPAVIMVFLFPCFMSHFLVLEFNHLRAG